MARELGDYLNDVLGESGEPTNWQQAVQAIQQACLRLGEDRQRCYGTGNIAKFGLHGVCIRSTDKVERLSTMLFQHGSAAAETLEDTCGDLANYGTYGVMLQRGWWGLPLAEEKP